MALQASVHFAQDSALRLVESVRDSVTDDESAALSKNFSVCAILSNINPAPSDSLRDIVQKAAQLAFKDAKILPKEFIERFKSERAAEKVIKLFLESLKAQFGSGLSDSLDPYFKAAKEDLRKYLQRYDAFQTTTLYRFLQSYPGINYAALFDESVIAQLKEILEGIVPDIAEKEFRKPFEDFLSPRGNQEITIQNVHNLVLDFIFSCVLSFDKNGIPLVEQDHLLELLKLLDRYGFEIEHLYLLLYRELYTMFRLVHEQDSVRTRISEMDPRFALKGFPECSVFHKDFDFDDFFRQFFIPVIVQTRSVNEPEHIRLYDDINLNPAGMARCVSSFRAKEPISRLAEHDIPTFNDRAKEILNYVDVPRIPPKILDQSFQPEIQRQLASVRDFIKDIISKALKMRTDEKDPIHRDCSFIPELLQCSNLQELVLWVSNPVFFKMRFPKYRDEPLKIIRYQARRILEFFLFYRRHIFRDSYKKAPAQRSLLESHLRERLKIDPDKIKPVTVRFRAYAEIDMQTKKPLPGAPYQVFYEYDPFTGERTEEAELFSEDAPEGKVPFTHGPDKKIYLLYPIEEKKFCRVPVAIPPGIDEKKQHSHGTTLLIYTGDSHLVHAKSPFSYISSLLRNKTPTDVLRWMIVTKNIQDQIAMRNFLYGFYSAGKDSDAKIQDVAEKRVDKRSYGSKTTGSQSYLEQRPFSGVFYATLPQMSPRSRKTGKRKFEYEHIEWETQMNNLDGLIVSLSDYTPTSHERAYTPEREWGNMFEYLFPPLIYGQRFAKYYFQGFRNGGNGIDVTF